MSDQRPIHSKHSYKTIATVVVIVTALVSTGIYLTMTTNQDTTGCIQTGIHGTLYIRVIEDSTNDPVSGADVTGTITNYCTPNYHVAWGLTNSTGYTQNGIEWTGNFMMSVVYDGEQYTFPAQTSGAVSLVTLSIPSGITVESTIACNGFDCQYIGNSTTAS